MNAFQRFEGVLHAEAVSLLDLDEAGVGACAVELDPTPGSRFYRVTER